MSACQWSEHDSIGSMCADLELTGFRARTKESQCRVWTTRQVDLCVSVRRLMSPRDHHPLHHRLDVHIELRLRGREPLESLNSGLRASGIKGTICRCMCTRLGVISESFVCKALQNFVREEPDAYS